MDKKDSVHNVMEDLRLNPQLRLCSKFDEESIAKFRGAAPGEMGNHLR